MFKKFITIISTLVFAFALVSCGGEDTKSNTSTSSNATQTVEEPEETVELNGQWMAVGEDDISKMAAVIRPDFIEIHLVADDTSYLYWSGTFPIEQIVEDGTEITSEADTKKLETSMLGSQDLTKVFTYEDDELTFEFRIMGSTKTVHLQRV